MIKYWKPVVRLNRSAHVPYSCHPSVAPWALACLNFPSSHPSAHYYHQWRPTRRVIFLTSCWNSLVHRKRSESDVRRRVLGRNDASQSALLCLPFSLQNITEYFLSVALDTSEDEPESEEEIEDLNPYPFDGKYVDEADRQKCVMAFALKSLSELTTPPVQSIKHARN